MDFESYNQAVQFCSQSAMLKPSKPFKRLPAGTWHVTLANRLAQAAASYIRFKTPCATVPNPAMLQIVNTVLAQIQARAHLPEGN
jgi:hypothetical protein